MHPCIGLKAEPDMKLTRCAWVDLNNPLYVHYHDHEWGVPLRGNDHALFERLCLEGAQAGLSWITILRKREAYRAAYDGFDPAVVARYDDVKMASLAADPGIVRNRAKIAASVGNARAFLAVQAEFGSFDAYLWHYVNDTPIQNSWRSLAEIPTETQLSRALSKDLRVRGFKFVGPTICYAMMQAIGMVNDHTIDCFRHEQVAAHTG
jgi:DNA-3-methyladenine glycosylase I